MSAPRARLRTLRVEFLNIPLEHNSSKIFVKKIIKQKI